MSADPYAHLDPNLPIEWWQAEARMQGDRAARALIAQGRAGARASWAEECAIVALRLVGRTGGLKPRTEDERLVIEWAEANPRLKTPGANKRLAFPHPDRDGYRREATANAQLVLGDEAA